MLLASVKMVKINNIYTIGYVKEVVGFAPYLILVSQHSGAGS